MLDPASRRSASVDLVVWAFACRAGVDESDADLLREAVGEFMVRHDILLSHFEVDGDPQDLVDAAVVSFWPDWDAVEGGLPRNGVELVPLAMSTLDESDAETVGAAASSVLALLAPVASGLSFAAEVAVEILEALAFAAVIRPLSVDAP